MQDNTCCRQSNTPLQGCQERRWPEKKGPSDFMGFCLNRKTGFISPRITFPGLSIPWIPKEPEKVQPKWVTNRRYDLFPTWLAAQRVPLNRQRPYYLRPEKILKNNSLNHGPLLRKFFIANAWKFLFHAEFTLWFLQRSVQHMGISRQIYLHDPIYVVYWILASLYLGNLSVCQGGNLKNTFF